MVMFENKQITLFHCLILLKQGLVFTAQCALLDREKEITRSYLKDDALKDILFICFFLDSPAGYVCMYVCCPGGLSIFFC